MKMDIVNCKYADFSNLKPNAFNYSTVMPRVIDVQTLF